MKDDYDKLCEDLLANGLVDDKAELLLLPKAIYTHTAVVGVKYSINDDTDIALRTLTPTFITDIICFKLLNLS